MILLNLNLQGKIYEFLKKLCQAVFLHILLMVLTEPPSPYSVN